METEVTGRITTWKRRWRSKGSTQLLGRAPGATNVPLHMLPPWRGPPRNHPQRTVTSTGETTEGQKIHPAGGRCRAPASCRGHAPRLGAAAPRAVISPCVISRADGPPGKERNHIWSPDSGAAGSTSPPCCHCRCPSSARAHSSALGKTRRCSPGAARPGIGAAEGMGHHSSRAADPPSRTTSWLPHTLQVVAITIHSSL